MADIREQIRQVDEDYLIGMSNKGIVKRAKKDLEKETPSVQWGEAEAQVALKEETCVICVPFGDSRCSCPSPNICRHVVTAILWLKQELAAEADNLSADDGRQEEGGGEESGRAGNGGEGSGRAGNGRDEDGGTGNGKEEDSRTENGREEKKAAHEFTELLQLPVERLKRACGVSRFRHLLAHLRAGESALVTETSIVTVTAPWEKETVKLLEPLEHSTCTCHSRELCAHKAQALLLYRLHKGAISLSGLEALLEEEVAFDKENVRQTASTVEAAVVEQLSTGLSRQSPDVGESLERLAVLCHQAGLARMESSLRETAENYRQYFIRSAAFRTGELLERLLFLHDRAKRIQAAENSEELLRLAGSFRENYEPVGRLRLMGLGARSFSSKSGYEGEIWYFLETAQRKWYTWTDARPVFYEGMPKRAGQYGNEQAPWNLECRREELSELEFELIGAKAAGRRLSVSQETRGQIIGNRNLQTPAFAESIAWDYRQLLWERFRPEVSRDGGEMLALVGAVDWEKPVFDRISQRFCWRLYDGKGGSLAVSVQYTKEERLTVQLLERLERRLRGQDREALVFFGSLYLEGGQLCLYPIEFYSRLSRRPGGAAEPELEVGSKPESEAVSELGLAAGSEVGSEPGSQVESGQISASVVKSVSGYVEETRGVLADLLASGLSSAGEETLSALRQLREDGERLGLQQAAGELRQVVQYLEERRHRMDFSPEPAVDAMRRLWRYLTACRKKLLYDEVFYGFNERALKMDDAKKGGTRQ